MTVSLEVAILLINIGLGAACVALIRIFVNSIFADIAKFLFILAVALMAHSAIDVFLAGPYTFFVYGITALIASICYLLMVAAVYEALRNLSERTGGR